MSEINLQSFGSFSNSRGMYYILSGIYDDKQISRYLGDTHDNYIRINWRNKQQSFVKTWYVIFFQSIKICKSRNRQICNKNLTLYKNSTIWIGKLLWLNKITSSLFKNWTIAVWIYFWEIWRFWWWKICFHPFWLRKFRSLNHA